MKNKNCILLKKLIMVFAVAMAVLAVSFIPAKSFAESNNMALAQYYAALAAMGGDENTTVEQAQQLAYQYALLAQQEALAQGGVAADVSGMTIPTAGMVKVTNKNASPEFYASQVNILNAMPQALKDLMIKYNAEYITTASGADFGQPEASGMCQAVQTTKGKKRSLKLTIYLAESPANPNVAHTIFHETAHALDSIIWQQTGREASKSQDFKNAEAGETANMYSLYIGSNMIDSAAEHYADSVAAFYIKNAQLLEKCPNLYAYCLTHVPY